MVDPVEGLLTTVSSSWFFFVAVDTRVNQGYRARLGLVATAFLMLMYPAAEYRAHS